MTTFTSGVATISQSSRHPAFRRYRAGASVSDAESQISIPFMIFKTRLIPAAAFLLTITLGNAGDFASLVNPFIGASTSVQQAGVHHGLGKTFPGATLPFGMVQVSPNTITGGDNGNGYSYEHEFIEGFAFTQMSGVGWYGDLGNFLVTPTVGDLEVVAGRHPEVAQGYRVKVPQGLRSGRSRILRGDARQRCSYGGDGVVPQWNSQVHLFEKRAVTRADRPRAQSGRHVR